MSLAKPSAILTFLLACGTTHAFAAPDHNYELVGTKPQAFDVYNDGRNTYVEIVRGLVVPGSKREGDSFVVEGVQREIAAQFGGKKISIKLRTPVAMNLAQDHDYAIAIASAPASQQIAQVPAASPASIEPPATPSPSIEQMLAEMREQVRAQVQAEMKAIEERKQAQVITAAQDALQTSTDTAAPQAAPEVPAAPPMHEKIATPLLAATDMAIAVEAKPAAENSVGAMQSTEQTVASGQAAQGKAAPLMPPVNEAFQVSEKVMFAEQAPKEVKKLTVIKKDRLIDEGLQEVAEAEGWSFFWNSKKHWPAIADIDISKYKSADETAEDIVNGLREEGKPIQLRISEGNKVMEVFSTEVKND